MEISAVSARKAVSSFFSSPFSDQSHLQFYGHGSSTFLAPSKLHLKIACPSLTYKPVHAPVRVFRSSTCEAAMDVNAEQALMKELADLKLQMKQKKRELKVHMKEDKKKLKMHLKEEKKRKKQVEAQEGKTKMKCQTESSSSSSESCGKECSSVSMRMLRHGQSMPQDRRFKGKGLLPDNCISNSSVQALSVCTSFNSDTTEVCDESFSGFPCLSNDAIEFRPEKQSCRRGSSEISFSVSSMGSLDGTKPISKAIPEPVDVQKYDSRDRNMPPCKIAVIDQWGGTSGVLSAQPVSNKIEVCSGGKCKKAGSQELLRKLQGQIPGSSNVEAVPCKCMGKCSSAINVRVVKEDANPQHHSEVGVEDGSLILSHHFGIGRVSVALPALSAGDKIRAPLPLAVV